MKTSALALPLLVLAAGAFAVQPCTLPRFSPPMALLRAAQPQDSPTLAAPVAGDFDGDGHPDLAAVDPGTGDLVILFGDGAGGFLPARDAGPGGTLLRTGDFDGDRRTDLHVVRANEMQPLFVGRDRVVRLGTAVPLAGALDVMTGDIDGDGDADMVVRGAGGLLAYLSDGSGNFGPPVSTTFPSGLAVSASAASDFNGDGKLDVLLVGPYGHPGALYAGTGNGAFTQTAARGPDMDYPKTVVADFNGDGLPDVAVAGFVFRFSQWPALAVHLGSRTEGLVLSQQPFAPPVRSLVAGDFDGDGHADVLGVSDQLYLFAGDGAGKLSTEKPEGPPTAAELLALDVDGDGVPDLVTQQWNGSLDLWRNGCGGQGPDVVLPAVVSVDGEGGTHFESQVTFANRASAPMSLELTLAGARATWTLPPGEKTFGSVAELAQGTGLSLPSPRVAGPLGIRVLEGSPLQLAARVRTTSQVPGVSGRGGVSYAGVPRSQALRSVAFVPWLAEDAANRSNATIVHAGAVEDGAVTLRVSVSSGNGGVPSPVIQVSLVAGMSLQLDHVLRLAGSATRGYLRVERVSGTAPWLAYAVVNDNATGDGSWEDAIDEDFLRRRRGALFVPAIVENARYESELVITNVGDASQRLEATWRPRGFPPVTAAIDLEPGAQVDLPGFVQHLRDASVPGVPPRGADLAGALELRSAAGDLSGILAGARTRTPAGFGVFTPALSESEAAFGSAWLFGLRQDAEARSNVALLNVSAVDARFTLEVHDAGGGTWSIPDVFVGAGQSLQLDRFLAQDGGAHPEAFVKVVGYPAAAPWGPTPAFLTYGVVNEGAEPGQGSGDGSYVPMQTW